jgi:hypothetical protein
MTITAAIPPVFDAYATVVIPEDDALRPSSDSALLEVLTAHTPDQPWWLGYLDTGAHDVVFDRAWKIMLYSGWPNRGRVMAHWRPMARTAARPHIPCRPHMAGFDALG